jgi:dipeptidyl aminopeptidase/acylaminoacyl peptidase
MFRTIIICATFGCAAASAAQDLPPLQPRDVFALEAASSPRISPNGNHIAYVRRSNDILQDQTRNSLWMVDFDGRNHLPIATGENTASSPRWSPSGDRLAYIANGPEYSAIRMYWMADGRDAEIAQLQGGGGGLSWSPDGRQLAYSAYVLQPGPAPADLPATPPGAEWARPAQVEDRLFYRIDSVGNLPPGAQQLFVVDAQGGAPILITSDDAGASNDFSWTTDGDAIIFSADRRPDAGTAAPDSELHRVNLETGRITQLTNRTGPDTEPRVSPNGQRIAYTGYDDQRMGYHNTLLYVANIDGTDARTLTADLDRSVGSPVWAADGRGVYIQYDDHGRTRLALVRLDGTIEPIGGGLGGSTFGRPYTGGEFTVARNGRIAATLASPTRPSEIASGTRRSGLNIITRLNEDALANRYVSPVEEILWQSPHDGRQMQGWALFPPGFDPDREYPLILEIHGGPFTAYGPVFSAELQLMAAAGYVVLYTNPRGSTSYGYEFANLIHHDYPGNDYDDLMGGVDAMIARGFIDEDRLFVTGGSGGGVLTAWIIGNTDRFAASAVVKPVINWSSFVLHSDLPQFFYRYWFANAPWEDPEEYWRRSPLSLVGNVTTPTLMMVGGADIRTPRSETDQYYAALRLQGVPSRLVVLPDSYHGISNSRPSRLLAKVAEILRWFEMYDPEKTAQQP